ncbi:dipeptide ABC transporter ATP-binding protein [Raineyella fluvialis]|uniref:Dipeptide ABC transporter ATP-binding protein n=1 Tax=Raineyella fluvialis TaxID=2662261 RepID=A0A5Q2FC12_9ACTN|nr:ABC transporter ATP-binding protein [Raineyella fluvialis]QGF24432.1 dipeptide ABC transporter ATP-binding protein [Raineyella fluvialis]
MTQALVRVQDLRIAFGRRRREAVHGLSFSIAPGQRVGLIGESGSGKSVTGLALLGLLPETANVSGSIRLVDPRAGGATVEVTTASDRRLSRLRGDAYSMVFQEPMTALDPTMKVGRQLGELVLLHGHRTGIGTRARVLEMLREVALPDVERIADSFPHQLSGGQRQRVLIAMALVNRPVLTICDEPTTALDVTAQAAVLGVLDRHFSEQAAATLFITHDLAVLAQLAEVVMVMIDGHVVEAGPLLEVLADPWHPYTRGLVATGRLDRATPGSRLPTVADHFDRAAGVDGLTLVPDDWAHCAAVAGRPGAPHERGGDAMTEEALYRLSDVVRRYGNAARPAVDHVTLEVRRGERLGIVGESGSGKSTLVRMMAALDRPTSGSITFRGTELAGRSERRLGFLRASVQLVFQDPRTSLDPRMTVGSSITEPLRSRLVRGRDSVPVDRRARLAEVMRQVGLDPDDATRFPHEFSGGQRQRIALARALAPHPEVLIADEPVSALDVSVRAQVLNLIVDLVAAEGLTLVFVSHDLGVVRHLCDRVAVMQNGSVVEAGPAEQIWTAPRHPYTQELLAAIPRLPDQAGFQG